MQAQIEQASERRSSTIAAERARERGIRAVIVLTLVTMALEISTGYWTGSLALIADGWHMATHVGALGLAAVAYEVARRFAAHRAFVFGTGKVHALAGYTSALALGFIAIEMMVESVSRLLEPQRIDFARSLPVAALGLAVNLASVRLLHQGKEASGAHDEATGPHGHDSAEQGQDAHAHGKHAHHGHGHQRGHDRQGHAAHAAHDHNHRAAVVHVLADTCTSALAIGALLAGQFLGWVWLDPVSGLLGGAVVLAWGVSLCRDTALELLNVDASTVSERIRTVLEEMQGVQVTDLRVWPMGRGARGCVMTLSAAAPLHVAEYRRRVLQDFELEHLTIEVRREPDA